MADFDSTSYVQRRNLDDFPANITLLQNFSSKLIFCLRIFGQKVYSGKWHIPKYPQHSTYQAFYDLEHDNLSETGSFRIRKINQPTRCTFQIWRVAGSEDVAFATLPTTPFDFQSKIINVCHPTLLKIRFKITVNPPPQKKKERHSQN